MSPSEIINEDAPYPTFTKEELTRRILLLEDTIDIMSLRLEKLDDCTFVGITLTNRKGISYAQKH